MQSNVYIETILYFTREFTIFEHLLSRIVQQWKHIKTRAAPPTPYSISTPRDRYPGKGQRPEPPRNWFIETLFDLFVIFITLIYFVIQK